MNNIVKEPYSADIWDEVEIWSRDQLESFQLEALKKQLQRVNDTSSHYQKVFAETGFDPRDFKSFDDIRRLPLTRKKDFVAGLAEDPPFGSFRAIDMKDAARVHFSSGTTSKPAPMLWSHSDLPRWADLYARYLYAQGLRRGDVFHCMFGYSWFVGGLGATLAAQHLGAMVIPGGSVDTQRQVETIMDYRPKAVVGTPSFMAHIAETAQGMGVDLVNSSVQMVCVGGEPGGSVPGTRERIEALWGAKMFDCYGALEAQPIGWDTALQLGPQLAEDFLYVEILHPETNEPVADGERGVLVLTHLDKQACPLVRWWTGDVVVRDSSVAPDGRTHARLTNGVLGRADDMLIVRGVNLFPSSVEDIIRSQGELANEYQLVIDESLRDPVTGFLRGIRVQVEAEQGDPKAAGDKLSHLLRSKLNVSFEVEVLPLGTLPRTVHKAARIIKK